MDKYQLYEQIAAGRRASVFKARLKGSLGYLAIKRYELPLLNHVRHSVSCLHALNEEGGAGAVCSNVLRFHEWYATSRHVWVCCELCAGGSLASIMAADGAFPTDAVRLFAADIVSALFHIHSKGLLLGDIRPSSFLADENGSLKCSDFTCAQRASSSDLLQRSRALPTSIGYTSPELLVCGGGISVEELAASLVLPAGPLQDDLLGGEGCRSTLGVVSRSSDIFAAGALLYHLAMGAVPYAGNTATESLVRMLTSCEEAIDDDANEASRVQRFVRFPLLPTPTGRSSSGSGKPPSNVSPSLWHLLTRMLHLDPTRRADWAEVLSHPFWRGNDLPPSSLLASNKHHSHRTPLCEQRYHDPRPVTMVQLPPVDSPSSYLLPGEPHWDAYFAERRAEAASWRLQRMLAEGEKDKEADVSAGSGTTTAASSQFEQSFNGVIIADKTQQLLQGRAEDEEEREAAGGKRSEEQDEEGEKELNSSSESKAEDEEAPQSRAADSTATSRGTETGREDAGCDDGEERVAAPAASQQTSSSSSSSDTSMRASTRYINNSSNASFGLQNNNNDGSGISENGTGRASPVRNLPLATSSATGTARTPAAESDEQEGHQQQGEQEAEASIATASSSVAGSPASSHHRHHRDADGSADGGGDEMSLLGVTSDLVSSFNARIKDLTMRRPAMLPDSASDAADDEASTSLTDLGATTNSRSNSSSATAAAEDVTRGGASMLMLDLDFKALPAPPALPAVPTAPVVETAASTNSSALTPHKEEKSEKSASSSSSSRASLTSTGNETAAAPGAASGAIDTSTSLSISSASIASALMMVKTATTSSAPAAMVGSVDASVNASVVTAVEPFSFALVPLNPSRGDMRKAALSLRSHTLLPGDVAVEPVAMTAGWPGAEIGNSNSSGGGVFDTESESMKPLLPFFKPFNTASEEGKAAIRGLTRDSVQRHIKECYQALVKCGEHTAQLTLLAYVCRLVQLSTSFTNWALNSTLTAALVRLITRSRSVTVQSRAAQTLGLMLRFATHISTSVVVKEHRLLEVLADVVDKAFPSAGAGVGNATAASTEAGLLSQRRHSIGGAAPSSSSSSTSSASSSALGGKPPLPLGGAGGSASRPSTSAVAGAAAEQTQHHPLAARYASGAFAELLFFLATQQADINAAAEAAAKKSGSSKRRVSSRESKEADGDDGERGEGKGGDEEEEDEAGQRELAASSSLLPPWLGDFLSRHALPDPLRPDDNPSMVAANLLRALLNVFAVAPQILPSVVASSSICERLLAIALGDVHHASRTRLLCLQAHNALRAAFSLSSSSSSSSSSSPAEGQEAEAEGKVTEVAAASRLSAMAQLIAAEARILDGLSSSTTAAAPLITIGGGGGGSSSGSSASAPPLVRPGTALGSSSATNNNVPAPATLSRIRQQAQGEDALRERLLQAHAATMGTLVWCAARQLLAEAKEEKEDTGMDAGEDREYRGFLATNEATDGARTSSNNSSVLGKTGDFSFSSTLLVPSPPVATTVTAPPKQAASLQRSLRKLQKGLVMMMAVASRSGLAIMTGGLDSPRHTQAHQQQAQGGHYASAHLALSTACKLASLFCTVVPPLIASALVRQQQQQQEEDPVTVTLEDLFALASSVSSMLCGGLPVAKTRLIDASEDLGLEKEADYLLKRVEASLGQATLVMRAVAVAALSTQNSRQQELTAEARGAFEAFLALERVKNTLSAQEEEKTLRSPPATFAAITGPWTSRLRSYSRSFFHQLTSAHSSSLSPSAPLRSDLGFVLQFLALAEAVAGVILLSSSQQQQGSGGAMMLVATTTEDDDEREMDSPLSQPSLAAAVFSSLAASLMTSDGAASAASAASAAGVDEVNRLRVQTLLEAAAALVRSLPMKQLLMAANKIKKSKIKIIDEGEAESDVLLVAFRPSTSPFDLLQWCCSELQRENAAAAAAGGITRATSLLVFIEACFDLLALVGPAGIGRGLTEAPSSSSVEGSSPADPQLLPLRAALRACCSQMEAAASSSPSLALSLLDYLLPLLSHLVSSAEEEEEEEEGEEGGKGGTGWTAMALDQGIPELLSRCFRAILGIAAEASKAANSKGAHLTTGVAERALRHLTSCLSVAGDLLCAVLAAVPSLPLLTPAVPAGSSGSAADERSSDACLHRELLKGSGAGAAPSSSSSSSSSALDRTIPFADGAAGHDDDDDDDEEERIYRDLDISDLAVARSANNNKTRNNRDALAGEELSTRLMPLLQVCAALVYACDRLAAKTVRATMATTGGAIASPRATSASHAIRSPRAATPLSPSAHAARGGQSERAGFSVGNDRHHHHHEDDRDHALLMPSSLGALPLELLSELSAAASDLALLLARAAPSRAVSHLVSSDGAGSSKTMIEQALSICGLTAASTAAVEGKSGEEHEEDDEYEDNSLDFSGAELLRLASSSSAVAASASSAAGQRSAAGGHTSGPFSSPPPTRQKAGGSIGSAAKGGSAAGSVAVEGFAASSRRMQKVAQSLTPLLL